MSVNRGMGNENVVYLHNRILFMVKINEFLKFTGINEARNDYFEVTQTGKDKCQIFVLSHLRMLALNL